MRLSDGQKNTLSIRACRVARQTRTGTRFPVIQFGGGFTVLVQRDPVSIAPTFIGVSRRTGEHLHRRAPFQLANQAEARQLGLIDWSVDTWTVRPALDFQYKYTWHRTIFTLSSDPTYFYTQSFHSSSANVDISGNSVTWENKLRRRHAAQHGIVRP